MTADIALFVYRRPEHTARVIDALRSASLAAASRLIVFSDGARHLKDRAAVDAVRKLLKGIDGFASVEVRERPVNLGLSASIISGVTEIVNHSGRVIVVEDDLLVSPYFLQFMNDALELYEHDEQVASIHGYVYPTSMALPESFFVRGADCWGWATWGRAWKHFNGDSLGLLKELKRRRLVRAFDFGGAFPFSRMLKAQAEGRVDSWAIRWHASAFLDEMYTLYPGQSLVQNIGTDGSGEHSGSGNAYRVSLSPNPIEVKRIPVSESMQARQQFSKFLRSQRPSYASRARRRLARSLRLP